MLVIGLTGGIGSGKSLAGQCFSELGAEVIDADEIARELIASHAEVKQKIGAWFKDVIHHDGSIDRKKLKELIFNNANARLRLEKLLHPLIINEINSRVLATTAPYCILMAPLLIEHIELLPVSRLLVTDASMHNRIKRVKERDHLPEEAIHKIIATQLPQEAYLNAADDVIHNEGDLKSLQATVKELHQKYLSLSKES